MLFIRFVFVFYSINLMIFGVLSLYPWYLPQFYLICWNWSWSFSISLTLLASSDISRPVRSLSNVSMHIMGDFYDFKTLHIIVCGILRNFQKLTYQPLSPHKNIPVFAFSKIILLTLSFIFFIVYSFIFPGKLMTFHKFFNFHWDFASFTQKFSRNWLFNR